MDNPIRRILGTRVRLSVIPGSCWLRQASRFLALIAMTRRFDILDVVLREVGGTALDGQQAKVFRPGLDYLAS
ncbi:MAG: hypothetical protein IE933_06255 [Sphingomonadales bacterium]|nr:hypothetical protein [Sphingomonadales bacterium]